MAPTATGARRSPTRTIPAGATWIDLEEPTHEEEKLVEQAIAHKRHQGGVAEIEPSSRLFEREGALY